MEVSFNLDGLRDCLELSDLGAPVRDCFEMSNDLDGLRDRLERPGHLTDLEAPVKRSSRSVRRVATLVVSEIDWKRATVVTV